VRVEGKEEREGSCAMGDKMKRVKLYLTSVMLKSGCFYSIRGFFYEIPVIHDYHMGINHKYHLFGFSQDEIWKLLS
jgi:hypothetical protein